MNQTNLLQNPEALLRYSRQIMLSQVGINGQQALANSTVLILGLGGLGSPAAMYLAAAGVGRLMLVDHDHVELSNLQRQIIHTTANIGKSKVSSAEDMLMQQNPLTSIELFDSPWDKALLESWMSKADIVLDCTDNFEARFQINEVSVATKTPLVSAAVVKMEGQLAVYDPRERDNACYQCLYQPSDAAALNCAQQGVLAPVAGMLGCMQATETIKVLIDQPSLTSELLLVDALNNDFRRIKIRKDETCPVCSV